MKDKIYIAKIGKTVGLKGHLKLYIDSDFPEQFSKNSTFTTTKDIVLTIDNFNIKNDLIKFVGYDTIEDSSKLVNQQLLSTIEKTKDSCVLQDKQYFWFDLIGCKIIENDKLLGNVLDIHRYPLDDYLEIQADTKTFLLPYTKQYIVAVNIEKELIIAQGACDILEAS
ncbi:16S rRNA processing protein RimM [hydrothermal vent metagenome]|uniref:16S rRNA processing protein RimM n=1 Tax=hydrothermal vent metagenome TaxID=652676 RepID=A0A3B1E614_9ZZZZ